jgi:hypothetical protein
MKEENMLKMKQAPDQKKYTYQDCKDKDDQQRYDQFKFGLIPAGLHNAFFPYIGRQKSDSYIQQQRNNHEIIEITKEWNKIGNQIDGTEKIKHG